MISRLNLNIFSIITSHATSISLTILVKAGVRLEAYRCTEEPRISWTYPITGRVTQRHNCSTGQPDKAALNPARTGSRRAWDGLRCTGDFCRLTVLTAGRLRENPLLPVRSGEANTRLDSSVVTRVWWKNSIGIAHTSLSFGSNAERTVQDIHQNANIGCKKLWIWIQNVVGMLTLH